MLKEELILLLLVSTHIAVYSHSTFETFVRTDALRVAFTVIVEKKHSKTYCTALTER
jgi:hypothetical protein